MEDFEITTDKIKKEVKKIKNWKPLEKKVHGYWLKHFTSLRT